MRIHRLIGMCLLFLVPFARPGLAAPATDQVLLPTGEISVPVGAKVDLHLYDIDSSGALHEAAPVLPIPAWMLNGKPPEAADASEGKLSVNLTLTDATYVAPDKIPSVNPVAVAVQLIPGPGKPRTTLICNIRITEVENHFQIQGPRVQSEAFHQDDSHADNTFLSYAQMAVLQGDELSIQIAPMSGKSPGSDGGAGMTLGINGIKPGKYAWTVGNNENTSSTIATFNIKRDSGMTVYISSDCVPHNPPPGQSCKTISLEGVTTIKEYNPSTGEVKGYFQGNVLLVDPTSNKPTDKYAYAVGQFHARLIKIP